MKPAPITFEEFPPTLERDLKLELMRGVDPSLLIRYARGDLNASERNEAQAMLVQSRWAMGRLSALLKAGRKPNSLAKNILTSDHIDPRLWGMKEIEDRDLSLALLLEQI